MKEFLNRLANTVIALVLFPVVALALLLVGLRLFALDQVIANADRSTTEGDILVQKVEASVREVRDSTYEMVVSYISLLFGFKNDVSI